MAEQVKAQASPINYVSLDHALGNRISVIGGGGKSSLSRAMAVKTGLRYIELDALFWNPGWAESTADELAEKVTAAIDAAPDGWIADGHYWSKIGDLVLRQSDLVVWVDLPWRVMFWRTLKRSFQRAWDKNRICGDNTESWRMMFSRDSLLLYLITHRKTITQREERLQPLLPPGIPVIRLKSASELNRFYEAYGLKRAD